MAYPKKVKDQILGRMTVFIRSGKGVRETLRAASKANKIPYQTLRRWYYELPPYAVPRLIDPSWPLPQTIQLPSGAKAIFDVTSITYKGKPTKDEEIQIFRMAVESYGAILKIMDKEEQKRKNRRRKKENVEFFSQLDKFHSTTCWWVGDAAARFSEEEMGEYGRAVEQTKRDQGEAGARQVLAMIKEGNRPEKSFQLTSERTGIPITRLRRAYNILKT